MSFVPKGKDQDQGDTIKENGDTKEQYMFAEPISQEEYMQRNANRELENYGNGYNWYDEGSERDLGNNELGRDFYGEGHEKNFCGENMGFGREDLESEEIEAERMRQKKKTKVLNLMKNITKIIVGCSILITPAILVLILYPQIPLLAELNPEYPLYPSYSLFQVIACASILFSALWLFFPILDLIIKESLVIFSWVAIKLNPDKSHHIMENFQFVSSISSAIKYFIVSTIGLVAWIVVFFNNSVQAFTNHISGKSLTWNQFMFKCLLINFIASIMLLIESIVMKKLAATFHRSVYKDRLERQKILSKAIKLLESEYESGTSRLSVTSGIGSRKSTLSLEDTISSFEKHKGTTSLQTKTKKRSNMIFLGLVGNRKKMELIPKDFIDFFGDKEQAIEYFNIFDSGQNGVITKAEFQQAFLDYYFENKVLIKTLSDMSQVLGKLHKFLIICILIITIVISVMILSGNSMQNVTSLATLTVAWSFIFGNSLRTTFDCFVYLFMTNPYDVGDIVFIDDEKLEVKKIRLLSTIFVKLDGQHTMYQNSILQTKKIINFRRSKDQIEMFEIKIDFATPTEKVKELERRLKAFIDLRPLDYKPNLYMFCSSIDSCKVTYMKVGIMYRNNWQSSSYAKIRSNFVQKLRDELFNLEISCVYIKV
ncbi:hypothetical protein BB559_000983 [Furculomyces boomerangus]|uniref:EF-hand domain-containing protein n=1 Tax=Furculomyces boomerangus TaxID=61424 RepID=A0A2T9YE77_9FUNG|nr:hypothetical protein BB559_004516 [Furculomyces boomerangus]PVU99108.1 hypothetical protein BB559_000983 [Furculomyces boomerangus]